MSMDKKMSGLPPSYREAMNLPPAPLPAIPDGVNDGMNGRSTPMAVPISQPYQHDDWGIHHDEHELRMALRGLHMGIGTPTRTASPGEMRSYSPAPVRSYSPVPTGMSYSPAAMRSYSPAPMHAQSFSPEMDPLPIPQRSFSPAPSTRSYSPVPTRTYSPSPMELSIKHNRMSRDSVYSDSYSYKEQPQSYRPGAYLAPLRTCSPAPIMTRNRSPSAPAPPQHLAYEKPPVSPTRYTYPHPSYQQIPPPGHGTLYSNGNPKPSPSNWEYTTQFASQRPRDHRENSATSSYSSYSYTQRRPRSKSSTSQTSLSQSFTSPPVSPPAMCYSSTSTSPPSIAFTTPVSPPGTLATSPPVQFQNAASPQHPRALSPHPTSSTGYIPSPSPVQEYDDVSPAKSQAPGSISIPVPVPVPRRPAAPRFACISLSSTNRLRGIGLPAEIRALVSDSLLQGARPGIKDFSELAPGVVEWKIEGHPWQEAGEAPRARRIVKRILSTLSSVGWHLVTSVDLSRKDKEKDTLFFREGPPMEREFFAVGFADTDKMMIIDPPNLGVRAEFLKVVKRWPKGLQDYGERTKNCFEVKLGGTPWNGCSSDVTCHSRLLMLNLLSAMEGQGYELVAGVNLNKQRKSDSNVDVDSLIFATRM